MFNERKEVYVEEYVKSEQTAVQGKRIKILSIMMLVMFAAFIIRKIACHNITSVDDFQKYISSFGVAGPLVLTLLQAFQVIVPVLPGYLGCAAGAIAFGSATGFWCNYIGISLGSIAAYFIADMNINRCGIGGPVPEHRLHEIPVGVIFDKVCGERMA